MSTVDEAIEAGERALHDPVTDVHHEYRVGTSDWIPYCLCGWKGSEPYAVAEYDEHLAGLAIKAAWPVLSAGLRELHKPVWVCGNPKHTNPDVGCPECDDVCHTCNVSMPCPTVTELDRIDQELGIGGES